MRFSTAHVAALTFAAILAASVSTPSLAKVRQLTHVQGSSASAYAAVPMDDNSPIVDGHYAPGSTGYGRAAYNPEQPTDPDPRIGGSLKMRTDR